VLDCQWLRQLHASGLLKGCFLPDDTTAQLRTLQQARRTLHQEQDDWVRRMQKILDQMNVRVHRAVSDLTGQTGMRMLRAILGGERDPVALAKLRDPHCRLKEEEIARELAGVWRAELLFTLQVEMDAYDFLAGQIAKVDGEIIRRLERLREERKKEGKPTAPPPPPHPDKNKQERILKCGQGPLRRELTQTFGIDLTMIDGFGVEAAACVFMEIGPDLTKKFPTEEQFVSWLRLAPHLAISGGHPVRGKKKKHAGSHPLKKLLLSAAISQRQRNTPLGEQYRRIAYRKSAGVASFAVANKIARRLWRALAKGLEWATDYTHWQSTRDRQLLVRAQRDAAKLGMTLTPAPAT
jgi:transposase